MHTFHRFFSPPRKSCLTRSIALALAEDGRDLTSEALFSPGEQLTARIICKAPGIICGLPIILLILQQLHGEVEIELAGLDGQECFCGQAIAKINGDAALLLKAERVILNYICHLSGIATYTHKFCKLLQDSGTSILDTRKTLPGLRYPEKYAVLVGGGKNHRMNLEEMLMLKDNHIDRAGNITNAVNLLRRKYPDCPPLEVECRTEKEVHEAVNCNVERIMLDNMTPKDLIRILPYIPEGIETEISGGISLDNLEQFSGLGADYISIGGLTHSAPALDLSMIIE